ncbi:RHS repeat-associated core domain-containing protein [Marinobacter sp. NFXS9]|uniref:RHS repeat domain-containing protein n=1 Tax=Marinobacter sp. NFXS9 TaxID=2818433 RepID=UPI0032DF8303
MNRAFDNNGRISNLKTATNESRNFEYDALGNIVSILGNDEQHFEYDAENRLKVALSNDFSLGYDYDANGNRTWETVDGAERELTYSPESNVLKTVGGIAYSYDGRGNTVNDGEHTYQYDARNRLVSVDGGDTAEYGYNAMGARAFKRTQETYRISADLNQDGRKSVADLLTLLEIIHHRESPVRADLNQDGKVNHRDISCMATHLTHNWFLERFLHCRFGQQVEIEAKTRFVYDGANLMGEYDGQGDVKQEIIWLGEIPIGLLENGEIYFVETNQVNVPLAIVNAEKEKVWQWNLRPFGEGAIDGDPDNDGELLTFRLRLPGQYYDRETRTNYNYYRSYDTRVGRYIQADPIDLRGGLNIFAYAANNPLRNVDSYGLAYSPLGEHGMTRKQAGIAGGARCYSQQERRQIAKIIAGGIAGSPAGPPGVMIGMTAASMSNLLPTDSAVQGATKDAVLKSALAPNGTSMHVGEALGTALLYQLLPENGDPKGKASVAGAAVGGIVGGAPGYISGATFPWIEEAIYYLYGTSEDCECAT